MNVVKAAPNRATQFIYKLSDLEVKALSYAFGREFNDIENKELYRIALELLKKARDRHWWFECDCQSYDKPILFPRKIDSYLTLVHLNHRGKHADNCIFKEKKSVAGKETYKPTREYDTSFPIKLCSNLSSKLSIKKDSFFHDSVESRGANPLSKLGRTLYTILKVAGLDQLNSHQFDIMAQYKALHQAAKKLTLGNDIPLGEFFWTHPGQKVAAVMKIKNYKKEWLKGARPFGILLMVADSIEENTLYSKIGDKSYEIKLQDIKYSSGRLAKNLGPFLVLITITNFPDKPYWYDAYQGFAVPIYAKNCLLPMESQFERLTARSIFQKWWPYWERQNLEIQFTKPLFDYSVILEGKEEAVRPDFIIASKKNSVVLEVMGSHEKDYLERKKHTVSAMKQKWPLVEFDAYTASKKNRWKEDLDFSLKGVTRQLFNIDNL